MKWLDGITDSMGMSLNSSATPSFPSQPEGKIGLPRAMIAQLVKNPPAVQETLVQFLGRENLGRFHYFLLCFSKGSNCFYCNPQVVFSFLLTAVRISM